MKNYVKEYKGHNVPEGATHYGAATDLYKAGFYGKPDSNGVHQFSRLGARKFNGFFEILPSHAIELPEAPQEWMPEVGEECEVLDTCYAHPKHSEVKVKGFYNKQVWLTLPSGEDRVVLIANCKFRPLKTQQEKGREAFINTAIKSIDTTKFSMGQLDTVSKVINQLAVARFTAPKATDNDQK